MCTAIAYPGNVRCFGRNLDLERRFGESVVITPRRFPLIFRCADRMDEHYGFIGMAHMADGQPLYYDGMNEAGLGIAGLNFPGNAVYHPVRAGMDNIAPFELIPWILGRCANMDEAEDCLRRISVLDVPFSPALPLTPLHWMVTDGKRTLAVEPMADGLRLWDDPVGVLTNNPTFGRQMEHLADYMNLSSGPVKNRFAPDLDLEPCSRGMGAMGLPGDLSSQSRFVRAAFARMNTPAGALEEDTVTQFFHLLDFVAQPRGCVRLEDGSLEMTQYSCCCDLDRGIYYYTTYGNRQITGVALRGEELERNAPIVHVLNEKQQIRMEEPVTKKSTPDA